MLLNVIKILLNRVAHLCPGLTVLLVRVLGAHYGAAAEHHFVLSQGPCLVREDVLDLAQVLCDVEGATLHPSVRVLIIQIHILHDEEHLAHLHQLNGEVERDGDHHLGRESNTATATGLLRVHP